MARSGQHTFRLRFSDLHVSSCSHIRYHQIISSFRHLDLVSIGVALVLLGTGGALGIGHVGHVAQFQWLRGSSCATAACLVWAWTTWLSPCCFRRADGRWFVKGMALGCLGYLGIFFVILQGFVLNWLDIDWWRSIWLGHGMTWFLFCRSTWVRVYQVLNMFRVLCLFHPVLIWSQIHTNPGETCDASCGSLTCNKDVMSLLFRQFFMDEALYAVRGTACNGFEQWNNPYPVVQSNNVCRGVADSIRNNPSLIRCDLFSSGQNFCFCDGTTTTTTLAPEQWHLSPFGASDYDYIVPRSFPV